jgi:large subunit ribosomal protein L13
MTHEYTIDATNKRLGRLASEVAVLLMGKQLPDFARNKVPKVAVSVENIEQLDLAAKKKDTKTYDHYSGYPGGRKEYNMNKVIADKGTSEVFKKAVYGMLPGNKLRPEMMKNLTIQ